MALERNVKKKPARTADRRNVWLLILTTLLIVVSVVLFTPPNEKINQGLDIQGGLSVVLTAKSTDGAPVTPEDMEKSRAIIESRVNALGASEATVQEQGSDQILVQIPGLADTEEALATIGRTGSLEFARLDSFTDEEVRNAIDSGQTSGEGTVTDEFGNAFPSGQVEHMVVEAGTYTPIVTGADITNVTIGRESEGSTYYSVNITLNSQGAKAFADASRDLVADHGKIVIILDGEVQSAPAVQSEIPNGEVSITGQYSLEDAKALQTILESGSLPVSFEYAQSQVVGPTLGQDALVSGVVVALIGLAVVMLYLLFFYKGLGIITAAAMAVFAVLYLGILAALSAFHLFSLSLAGIAGIVLTIGMAADSSILTVERFREEIRMGRSVKAASITGVKHAIFTSIDADLVTMVSALCLFFLAAASVKGFGMTLALGIICDIAMMLIFKAPLIRLLAPKIIAKHPGFWGIKDSIEASKGYAELAAAEGVPEAEAETAAQMNAAETRVVAEGEGEPGSVAVTAVRKIRGRFIKHDINFLGYRKVFLTVAVVAMVACLAIVGIRGLNFGIEFELDAEVQAADADDSEASYHGDDGHGEEHLAVAEEVDVVLDEAAADLAHGGDGDRARLALALGDDAGLGGVHLGRRLGLGLGDALGGGQLGVTLRRLDGVLNAPEAGVLRDDLRREQADERRLEDEHHGDVADDAQGQRHTEALDGGGGEEEQAQRRDHGHEVGVDGGEDGVLHAGNGGRLHGAAHADLLAEALHREDGGVGSHTDGQHDAGDARQRQTEQVEGGKGRQDAEVEHGEHGHGRGGDDTEALVEEQQVQHDDRKADQRHHDAGDERVLAEGGADDLGLGVLEGHRQRAGLQDGLQRLGVFQRVLAGDGHLAVGDFGLHGRGGLHLAVQDDDNLAVVGHQIARGVGEGLGALGVQRDVHAVVGAALALAADGDVGDVGAGDDGRVGAGLHDHVLNLARGEGVAELVGHRALAGSLAGVDGVAHLFVGERIQAGELQRAGAPDGGERLLRIS